MTNSRFQPVRVGIVTTKQTVNNSETLVNAVNMVHSVKASTTYGFVIQLLIKSNATPDIKKEITLPSGATYTISVGAQSSNLPSATQTSQSGGHVTDDSNQILMLYGQLTISTTAGSAQFQFAQNNATASDTDLLVGSYFMIIEATS